MLSFAGVDNYTLDRKASKDSSDSACENGYFMKYIYNLLNQCVNKKHLFMVLKVTVYDCYILQNHKSEKLKVNEWNLNKNFNQLALCYMWTENT